LEDSSGIEVARMPLVGNDATTQEAQKCARRTLFGPSSQQQLLGKLDCRNELEDHKILTQISGNDPWKSGNESGNESKHE
jgi:hypothetical protein